MCTSILSLAFFALIPLFYVVHILLRRDVDE